MDDVKEMQEQEQTPAVQQEALATPQLSPKNFWTSMEEIKTAYKVAQMIAGSDLVPEGTYKGKPNNCLIAIEMANRTGFGLLHIMQNLYVVKGKPSWSGQFCAAAVNASNRFSPLTYVRILDDNGGTKGYYAKATRLSDGEICEGSPVTWDMVKAEGWYDKNGSKWKTMPDLMFHYRAAAFFVREHCPEVLCGLQTVEEVQDVKGYDTPKETTVISFD